MSANSAYRTLVAPPIWRYPRQPSKFFKMLYLNAKVKMETLVVMLAFKFNSCPRPFRSLPIFKAHRASAIPTAKALHARMSEALAAGDKETLRAICIPEMFRSLAHVIDNRGPNIRAEWEVLSYDRSWYYPRLADWRVMMIPIPNRPARNVKQAVVSISSVQRIARYDLSRGGAKIEGSERVRHLLEHIVLQAEIDDKTWEHGPWRIWGTLPEDTLESFLKQEADIRAVS
ncbi:hypothetical protein SLS62_007636 [Diatrype stigma]|uniref:Tim44-like domain-containing protein n=1 Tax=Diatrype stigma TaxID=117547 RepID=A0AAN9UPE5_9PEZI